MKKLISLLFLAVIALTLVGCSETKDKAKLIGEWHYKDTVYSHGTAGYFKSTYDDYYSFFKDNTFSCKYYDELYMSVDGISYFPLSPSSDTFSGTYTIKDGMITLKPSSGDRDEIEYPYTINEYTKELIFNVDRDGNSKWEKISSTPKEYGD